MKRRDVLRTLAAGPLLTGAGMLTGRDVLAQAAPALPQAPRGLPPIRIKDIKVVLTAPNRIRLVVVKVITDQPGLHGWGCATFTQRALVVQTASTIRARPLATSATYNPAPRCCGPFPLAREALHASGYRFNRAFHL